jgi:dipeptidyl aminopeptidase/acylaminoacyl peptidase
VTSNKRDERHFDLYRVSAEDYNEQMIYQNDDLYHIGPVSPDGQTIVLEKETDNRSRAISLHNLGSGETQKITPSDIHIYNHGETFSPDGASLYYTTDKWHEFKYLVRYDQESGEHSEVLRLDWDISSGFGSGRAVRLSEDGNRMAIALNQDARTVVDIYETDSMQRIGGSDTPDASVVSWDYSDDGNTLAYITSNGQVPGDIVLQDVGSGSSTRLVSSISEDVDPTDLIPGEVVRFLSYDGLTVPGILYKPLNASPENQVPALVWVHGGPGGETRIGYNPLLQYLANHGYAVYGVNNRGSSGSGKTFFHLDDQDHGGGDLRDIVTAKQFLVETGWINPEQVGVIGASYGGFMVLAAMAFHPEVFDAAVDIFGVANWVRTIGNPPPWWAARWVAMQTEMGDFNDESHWRERSPVFHAGNITRPLIVLQGENDPRVIKPESDAMVAEVRKNGTPVEYVVFDDEGHGFRKKKNEIRGYAAILEFLDEHLKGIGKE